MDTSSFVSNNTYRTISVVFLSQMMFRAVTTMSKIQSLKVIIAKKFQRRSHPDQILTTKPSSQLEAPVLFKPLNQMNWPIELRNSSRYPKNQKVSRLTCPAPRASRQPKIGNFRPQAMRLARQVFRVALRQRYYRPQRPLHSCSQKAFRSPQRSIFRNRCEAPH